MLIRSEIEMTNLVVTLIPIALIPFNVFSQCRHAF